METLDRLQSWIAEQRLQGVSLGEIMDALEMALDLAREEHESD